ncbi:MAG: site-specific integrase [Bacilli bacterium]|nr:site-specific integrase [Bacilli bacterium]
MGSVTIQKRGKYYQYKFEISKVKGKRQFINKSGFKTKGEAIKAGNIAYTKYLNTGLDFQEKNISFSDYLDYWYENYCLQNLKYNTQKTYKVIMDKYLKKDLGKYNLSALSSAKLNAFLVNICNTYNFKKSYYKNILKVLKNCFRIATDVYGFIQYNPTITLKLPKIEDENEFEKHLYSQKEINIILKRFENDDAFTCAFITACYTGLRTGEVCSLMWEDIDFKNRIINVQHTVYDKTNDGKGRWYIGTTKTKNGTRKVYMCDTLYNALLNYKSKQQYMRNLYGKAYKTYHYENVVGKNGRVLEKRIVENTTNLTHINSANMIFTRPNGKYVGRNILNYPFKIIHNELGIKNCRFYDLRGSYATINLRNGAEIRDVADILGHKFIETTENFYISSTEKTRNKVLTDFDNIINSDIINQIIKYKVSN